MATNLNNCYFTITNPTIADLTQIKSYEIYDETPTVTYANSGSSTQPTNTFTVYQMENQMVKFYNTFLTEYSKCVKNVTTICTNSLPDCTEAEKALIQARNMELILKSAIEKIPDSVKGNINQVMVDASYNYILSNYNNLVNTRSKLDQQMKDIQKTSDSVYSMYKGSYDSTMYSQILLTVLATSLIYYVFVKL